MPQPLFLRREKPLLVGGFSVFPKLSFSKNCWTEGPTQFVLELNKLIDLNIHIDWQMAHNFQGRELVVVCERKNDGRANRLNSGGFLTVRMNSLA